MCPEDCEEVNAGKWPAEYYSVANTKEELAALIEEMQWGFAISADVSDGCGFEFGRTSDGRFVFLSDEFLDDDETVENPDFHETIYSSALEGVEKFKINGKSLIDAMRGVRFFQYDIPLVVVA